MNKKIKNTLETLGALAFIGTFFGILGAINSCINYPDYKRMVEYHKKEYPEMKNKDYSSCFFGPPWDLRVDARKVRDQRKMLADLNNNGYLELSELSSYFIGTDPYSFFNDSEKIKELMQNIGHELTLEEALQAKFNPPARRVDVNLPYRKNSQ